MRPRLHVIDANASPEEVAAIVAALSLLTRGTVPPEPDETLHEWVRMARLRSRRAQPQRGPWRLSGRLERRRRP